MVVRFGLWNVRSPYRASLLKTIARELAKYNLDVVAVQEVRWNKGGSQTPNNYKIFY
jgi:exonuclease III